MQLVDEATGRLARSDGYKARYRNLSASSHNYVGQSRHISGSCLSFLQLRISRIMKCLGEFNYVKFPAAFNLFVLSEQSENGELDGSYLRSSMDRWWINCNRDDAERAVSPVTRCLLTLC